MTRLEGITNPLPSNPLVPLTEDQVERGNSYSALLRDFAVLGRVSRLEAASTDLEGVTRVGYAKVVPTSSTREWLYVGDNQRVVRLQAKRAVAVGAGAGVAELVVNDSGGQTLQSTAVSDAVPLTSSWSDLTLSVAPGRLNLEDGLIEFGINALDAGASGGPVWLRVTTTDIPA